MAAPVEQLVALSPGTRVSGRWTIIKKLGAGAFGAVYLCRNDQGQQAALKTEPVGSPHPLLAMEAKVLKALEALGPDERRHFCTCLELGRDQQMDAVSGQTVEFNYIVMSLVECSLDSLIKEVGGRFSPGTAIVLAIQLLNAIKTLHSIGYLHRDIKPANCAMLNGTLVLLDFGMARCYMKEDGTLRRLRASAHFRGTPIYAPISAHLRRDYTRRDDVESWFYVLIKFYKGAVPWKHMAFEQIGEMKCRRLPDKPQHVQRQAIAELVGGCPPEFSHILKHIDGLETQAEPDYAFIEALLRGAGPSTH